MLSINASRRLEQQQLLESLRSYEPWGRAGGGAPAGDVRRRDLISRYIYPQYPSAWADQKDRIPPARLRHRPRRNFFNTDLPKEPNAFNKELTGCQNCYQHDRSNADFERQFPQVRSNKVWSGDPWDGRGPWGSRGPGGNPWRPAGHVGRNFHHSMGWTTENTFPLISGINDNYCDKSKHSTKKEVTIKEDTVDQHKMPPINQKNTEIRDICQKYSSTGQRCAGGTPNGHLLNMTGGIELVPLMRARAWAYKQKPPNIDYLSQVINPQGVFQ